MTPESSEGRERIVRLESRIQDVAQDVERNERTFGPLPLAVERLQWTIDSINTRLDKRDREDEERFEKLARSFENQVIACKGSVDAVANEQKRQSEVFLAWQEKERERREAEKNAEKQDQTTDKTSRRAMWALIGAAAVTGVLGLITQLVTALS
jgi:chromosome segregation ATPase